MVTGPMLTRYGRWILGGLGAAAAGYLACVIATWLQYGRVAPPGRGEVDPLLDSVMPDYEVVERHQIRVRAPASRVFALALAANLQHSWVVRSIFRAREFVLGARPDRAWSSQGLLADVQKMGWRVLASRPDHEVVVGAVTQPWLADVTFRGLEPDAFRTFREPDFVKIAWTLRVHAAGPSYTILRTETRVVATDAQARRKFRGYWARFSPGIVLIRWFMLHQTKVEAERAGGSASERAAAAPDEATTR
ncbi:MAG: hypothetical protein AB7N65_29375 [Vicinamibacterales bacterium]